MAWGLCLMPLTGFYMNGICHASQAEAIDAFVSMTPVLTNSQYLTTLSAAASGVSAMTISTNTMNLAGAGNTFVAHSASLPLRPCDPVISTTPFFDGMTMGWGVVSAMAAAVAIIFIKKALFR